MTCKASFENPWKDSESGLLGTVDCEKFEGRSTSEFSAAILVKVLCEFSNSARTF